MQKQLLGFRAVNLADYKIIAFFPQSLTYFLSL
uniref:Uncharacterized protein n=1 Tax=Arundo donax TaxID=35708 RepID=A0A0A8XS69_ARUDO